MDKKLSPPSTVHEPFFFLSEAVRILGIALLAFLIFLCFSCRSFVEMDLSEVSHFQKQSPLFYLSVVLSLLLLCLSKYFLSKISCSSLLKICNIAYLILGLYLIMNVDPVLRSDQWYVFDSARRFSEDFLPPLFHAEYLYQYPHQLGLATYERLLMLFSKNAQLFFFVNLFFVMCINYHFYRLSDLWFDSNDLVNKCAILLSYMFFPQFFFILFVYGTIPGFACMVVSLYYATLLMKPNAVHKKRSLVFCLLFASLAIVLRNNYMIAVLALVCVFGLFFFERPRFQRAICVVLLALTIVLPQKAVIYGYEVGYGIDIAAGIPKSLWIAMGLQEGPRCNGWFNSYNTKLALQLDFNEECCNAVAKEEIHSRLEAFSNDPSYAADFFLTKIRSTWCEPTFQSVWSGPLPVHGVQQVHTSILKSLYLGRKLFKIFAAFCNILVVDILLLAFVYLIRFHKKENIIVLFPVIFLWGGFLFHLFWETKSQYVYMFIFMLIPLSAKAISGAPVFGFPFMHTKTAE